MRRFSAAWLSATQPFPGPRELTSRVGINLGDVIVAEHEIFGDGVNVGARLEALASPGSGSAGGGRTGSAQTPLPFR